MKIEKGKGIVIDEKDGRICESGGRPYWDAEFQQLVLRHLGDFCPSVSYTLTGKSENGEDRFSAAFSLRDDHGRELCNDSAPIGGKVKIPKTAVAELQNKINAFHQLAETPELRNMCASREFIRDFRLPDPMRMKEAWRVTLGKEPRLLVLWGWFDRQGGLNTTFLPKSTVSETAFGNNNRDDVMGRARPYVTPIKSGWMFGFAKWIRGFAALLMGIAAVTGLWWLFSQLDGCDGRKKHVDEWPPIENPSSPILPPETEMVGPHFSMTYNVSQPVDGMCECNSFISIEETNLIDRIVVHDVRFLWTNGDSCRTNAEQVAIATMEIEMLKDGKWVASCRPGYKTVCPAGVKITDWADVAWSDRETGFVSTNRVGPFSVTMPKEPERPSVQPEWNIGHSDKVEFFDEQSKRIPEGEAGEWRQAIHTVEFWLRPNNVAGVECYAPEKMQWVDLCDDGSMSVSTGATLKVEYLHEHAMGPIPLSHRIQARNITWTNKLSKVGGVGESAIYDWPEAKIYTPPPPPPPPELSCGTCGAQIPLDGQCPNLCKTCGVHLGRDGVGLWRECPNVCKKHNRHRVNGICPDCSGKIVDDVADCWIEIRSNPMTLNGKADFDNMTFSLRSSKADLSTARVRWEDEIDGKTEFVTNAVGSIQAADIIMHCVSKGLEWDKINRCHTLRALAVAAPDGIAVEYEANTQWKPRLTIKEREAIERHIRFCGEGRDGDDEYFLFMLYSHPADPKAEVNGWEAMLDKGMGSATRLRLVPEPKLNNAIRLYKKDIPRDGCVSISANVNVGRTVRAGFAYAANAIKIGHSISHSNFRRACSIAEEFRLSIPQVVTPTGSGTAFAVTDRDLITNYHVISGEEDNVWIKVVAGPRGESNKIRAKVQRYDQQSDLAWLKIVGTHRFASPLPLASGEDELVGMPVMVLGYPYDSSGEYESPKTGVVEIAADSSGRMLHNAEVLPGNSGGPLVSIVSGKVVGVTVAVKSRKIEDEMFYGDGCAIPVAQIFKSFPELAIKK